MNSSYTCQSCSKEYKSSTGILKHRRKHHPNTFSVECESCDTLFDTLEGMRKHHTRVHGESLRQHTFNCRACGSEKTIPKSWIEKEGRVDGKYCSKECKLQDKREVRKCRNDDCEEEFIVPSWKEVVFCSLKCCYGNRKGVNDRVYHTGEDNPNWKGGYEGYYGASWPDWRKKILKRDDYTCQACGYTDESNHVHHVKPVRDFDEPQDAHYDSNLVTLCVSCHSEAEARKSLS